jgi:hypothetical protein
MIPQPSDHIPSRILTTRCHGLIARKPQGGGVVHVG